MYWLKKSEKFFTIENYRISESPVPSNGRVGSVKIKLDQRSVIYGRVSDNIFGGLEAVGGFYESLIHIGMILVFFFQERLFKSSFIR